MNALPYGLIFEIAEQAGIPSKSRCDAKKKIVKCIDSAAHASGDKHPSAFLDAERNCYHCSACGLSLSAKKFAAAVGVEWKYGSPAEKVRVESAPTVRSAPEHIPADQLFALWSAARSVREPQFHAPNVYDMTVPFYLAGRRWFPWQVAELNLLRVLPKPEAYAWPTWWPKSWARTWRLIAPAYDAQGMFRSIHGRAVIPSSIKTRWPLGYPAGFLFADRRGAALLRGDFGDTDRVVIVEGLSDMVAISLEIHDARTKCAVLGITSGSIPTLGKVVWPDVPIVVGTDHDAAGERYALEIVKLLDGRDLRRMNDPKAAAR